MAWLGNTFGDGLTSLKGQVSKLAKEVLSEDPLGTTSYEGRIKELEELCESHTAEIEKLSNENSRLKAGKSFELSDEQCQNMCALETQVLELTAEKRRLEKLLEELDVDHQKELELVFRDRELMKKKMDNNHQAEKGGDQTEELLAAIQQLNFQNDILLEDSKAKDKDLACFKDNVSQLNNQVKLLQQQNRDSKHAPKKQGLVDINLSSESLKHLEDEIKSLKIICEEKENELRDANVEIKSLRLKEENFEANESELIKNNAEMSTKVEGLELTIQQLQSDIINFKEELDVNRNRHLEMAKAVEEFRNKEECLSALIEKLQSDNMELVKKLKEFESVEVEEHCQYTEIIDGLKKEKSLLVNRCEELLEEINGLSENLKIECKRGEDVYKERVFCLKKLETQQLENESLVKKLSEVEELHMKQMSEQLLLVEGITLEKDSLAQELSSIKMKKENTCSNDLAQWEEATKTLQAKVLENKSKEELLSSKTLQLEEMLREAESRYAGLQKILEAATNTVKEENLWKEDEYQSLLLEKERVSKDLEEKITELQGELNSMESTFKEKDMVLSDNSRQLQSLTEERNKLALKVKDFEEKIESIENEFKGMINEKDVMLKVYEEKCELLENEKAGLFKRLGGFNEKIELDVDWVQSLEEEVMNMAEKVGVPSGEPGNVLSSLQIVKRKLEELVAERSERLAAVNNSLGPEIRKLKGLVNRIRREFMLSSSERGLSEEFQPIDDHLVGENLLSQSQTDDVKSLTQDVAQMTEIIGMIDRGLATILQEKSRLEKELSIVQSMSSRTEKELLTTVKGRDSLQEEKKELLLLIQKKDAELQSARMEVETLTGKLSEVENNCKLVNEEKGSLEHYVQVLQERLQATEALQESLQRFEHYTAEQTKKIEELSVEISARDEMIQQLKVVDTNTAGETANDWETVAKDMENKCLLLEQKCQKLEGNSNNVQDPQKTEELEDHLNRLQRENVELKELIGQLRENIYAMGSKQTIESTTEQPLQQHRRSLSQVAADSTGGGVEGLRAELQQEKTRYQTLSAHNQALIEKEASLRKELERLREHLVEVEDHYTTEAVETEKTLNEYRSKLSSAEEQLRNSSTVYKSANVRSTQHVEALQNQIKLMSIQRDDLQAKLSLTEDQVQKHSAALTSLQMVLEQFQVDKERELQAITTGHDYQLELAGRRVAELDSEIVALKNQLTEAQNGLKAGLRLGEQLDRKSQQILQLEEEVKKRQEEIEEARKKVTVLNESTAGKVDQFLVKNLVLGYLSASGNTKNQALKILATVLGLSEEEKAKIGVEEHGGWFSSLLHPSPNASPSEPLSQAFIRFLESESRPQPQLRLLSDVNVDQRNSVPKRPPMVLSDLVFPTVTPTQVTENAGSALKEVLRDS